MAEESDLEKTEPASSRRIEQAREEGNVPQSRELVAFLVLASGVVGIWAMSGWFSTRTTALMREGFIFPRQAAFDPAYMFNFFVHQGTEALITLGPLFLLIIAGAIAAPAMIGGLQLAPKALQFNFGRLDPLNGIKKIISMQGVAEMVKATMKAILVGGVIYYVITHKQDELFSLIGLPLETSLPQFMHLLLVCSLMMVGGVAMIAAIDVPFQLWQYYDKLKMTREELRQESKESDGNPEMKGRIRSQQREMAKKRMMESVPQADVVVTNPTHFAVALKYDSNSMAAPKVVAKGMNLIAGNIRELAEKHNIPILEAPPLARALYKHAEVDGLVPTALYMAVAEVMAYVYQLNAYLTATQPGVFKPEVPTEIDVPPELDPGVPDMVAA